MYKPAIDVCDEAPVFWKILTHLEKNIPFEDKVI